MAVRRHVRTTGDLPDPGHRGEKVPAYWEIAGEPNPQLGLRSIRFSLRHPEQFRQQIRAILRAGADTERLGIMFPMISSLDEFTRVRELVAESLQTLERERLPHHPAPALGAMLEVPAVVEIVDELAREADFLSIGTNDFVQYLLGVDRANDQVAYAYRPEHPCGPQDAQTPCRCRPPGRQRRERLRGDGLRP